MSAEAPGATKATLGWPFSFALNRLLAAEDWARRRLAPFAGATIEVRNPPFPTVRLLVLADGTLQAGGNAPALTVIAGPRALLELPRGREAFLRALDVEGDPALAAEVRLLARHLRWDAEEVLSSVFGDVAAHRLAEAGRAFIAWQTDAARRLAESLADYVIDEKRLLVAHPEMRRFADAVARLRDAVERLEKRVERLA